MPFHTALQQLKVPVRCTSSTFAKSAGSILPKDLSRKMPALAQSRSTLPHSFVARSTIAFTCSKLETSAPSAMATPPAFRIFLTPVVGGVQQSAGAVAGAAEIIDDDPCPAARQPQCVRASKAIARAGDDSDASVKPDCHDCSS